MLKFISHVSGQWLSPSNLQHYIKNLGENYPVIIKTFRGERSAVSLQKLQQYKDGISEAWFPTERNWNTIEKHGMAHLEKLADTILRYWN